MEAPTEYPLQRYEELEQLDHRGQVTLVRSREDGRLYVKKRVLSHAPEVYRQLMAQPAEGTPRIFGIWPEGELDQKAPAALVILEEYLPGHTLADQLRDRGPLSEEDCFRVGQRLCAILQQLHSRTPAIIHRDIKPSNVMLLPEGDVRLIDFSAAKPQRPREGRDTVLIGTAGFAAPEQYGFSASTVQTDIYSLGVLLNILRTGALPWERQAGGRLRRVLDRCLRMDPRDRYRSIRELSAALRRAQMQRFPWLPPGLRTMCWYKAVPALLTYSLLYAMHTVLFPAWQYSRLADRINYHLCGVLAWLLPLLFYSDYMGIRRLFPLMRSSRRWVRAVGMVLSPVWMYLLICLATTIITVMLQ